MVNDVTHTVTNRQKYSAVAISISRIANLCNVLIAALTQKLLQRDRVKYVTNRKPSSTISFLFAKNPSGRFSNSPFG